MSLPRPTIRPSLTTPANGGTVQFSAGAGRRRCGTSADRWPAPLAESVDELSRSGTGRRLAATPPREGGSSSAAGVSLPGGLEGRSDQLQQDSTARRAAPRGDVIEPGARELADPLERKPPARAVSRSAGERERQFRTASCAASKGREESSIQPRRNPAPMTRAASIRAPERRGRERHAISPERRT